MNAQGSGIFDTQYVDGLTDRINKIDSCAELKKLTDEALSSFQAQIEAAQTQMAILKPIAELLENPAAELPKIVEWIGNLIEGVLKPMYQPYVTMEGQLVAAVTAYAQLVAAIESATARIGECVIEVPALVVAEVAS